MMKTRIAGIPCQVTVTRYTPADSGSFFEPPSGPDIEFDVFDRLGYRANWLQAKVTGADELAIIKQHEAELRDDRDEHRINAYIDSLEAQAWA